MKGVICRTEWPICLGLSLPGVPQGFPMVQGGEGRLQMWGRQPWQPLALHRLGPARSWQEVCDGVAGNVLWLAEGLHFPESLRNHLVFLHGTAARAQHFIWLCPVGAERCPASTWMLPSCWGVRAWPLSLPMACDLPSEPHYSFSLQNFWADFGDFRNKCL